MYQVRCDDKVIYDLRDEDLKIISPKLNTEVNKTGTFNFKVPPQNPMYDYIYKLKSIITIYQDDEEIWRGRVLNDKLDLYNRKQVECEGELSFLLDSIQRPYEFQGSPNDLFRQFINNHNSQVEETKKFILRNVDVPDGNDYINRSNSNYSNTWESTNDKLINTNTGYLETGPLENGKRYIDYLSEYTHVNTQIIQFGENLLDITQYAKGENIKTAIIPLGYKDQETQVALTIKDVNDGKDYIYDETAVSLFGWIWDTVEYKDVTLPENLLRKGIQYLDSVINESITLELTAVDLHNLDCDIEKFKKGDLVRVISIPHKLDRYFLVSKLSLSLDNPKESKLTLGQTFNTLTQKHIEENKIIVNYINTTNNESVSVKNEINNIKQNVRNINTVIVEIPTEYAKNSDFTSFRTEVLQKIGRVYTIKGNVANYAALSQLSVKEIGDVYNVLTTGANYVWTDTGWDKLSETIDLSAYLTKVEASNTYATIVALENYYTKEEVDELLATYAKKTDFDSLVLRVEALENVNQEENESEGGNE